MKILFIAPKYSGGIGGHAARVAEKLQEHGFDITLMHTSHIPIKKLKNPSFAALSSLKAIVGTEKYDIVHAFNVPSAFAMKYTKAKKKILSIHGIYSDQVDALHSKTISNSDQSNSVGLYVENIFIGPVPQSIKPSPIFISLGKHII